MNSFYEDMDRITDEVMNYIECEVEKLPKYEAHISAWTEYMTDTTLDDVIRNLSKSSIIKKY